MKKIPSSIVYKQMVPGEMTTIRIFKSGKQKYQTSFVIKDYNNILQEILDCNTTNARSYIDTYRNAAGLIHMVSFGENNKHLYNYWFDYRRKGLNKWELEDLKEQPEVEILLVDENNRMVNVLTIPNILPMAIEVYVDTAKYRNWSRRDYDSFKNYILTEFKGIRELWNSCPSGI